MSQKDDLIKNLENDLMIAEVNSFLFIFLRRKL